METDEVGSKLGSEQFVAIRVEAGSLSHQQFSEFCILFFNINKTNIFLVMI